MNDEKSPERRAIKTICLPPEDVARVEVARAKDQRSFSFMIHLLLELGIEEWWRRRGEIEPRPDAPRDTTEPDTEIE